MNPSESFTIAFDAETRGLEDAIKRMTTLGDQFVKSLGNGLHDIAFSGASVSDIFRDIAQDLTRVALASALAPLRGVVGSALGGLVPALGSAMQGLAPIPFARGGVFDQPALTALPGARLGVIGEAGPEAVLPLTRGRDGRLGVRSADGGSAVSVTVNISTPDVGGFRRSEAQVATMLARAVERGRRGL